MEGIKKGDSVLHIETSTYCDRAAMETLLKELKAVNEICKAIINLNDHDRRKVITTVCALLGIEIIIENTIGR